MREQGRAANVWCASKGVRKQRTLTRSSKCARQRHWPCVHMVMPRPMHKGRAGYFCRVHNNRTTGLGEARKPALLPRSDRWAREPAQDTGPHPYDRSRCNTLRHARKTVGLVSMVNRSEVLANRCLQHALQTAIAFLRRRTIWAVHNTVVLSHAARSNPPNHHHSSMLISESSRPTC